MRSILGEEDEGFDFDPGFTFDEQGDIVIHDARAPGQPESTARPGPVPLGSDSAASARVRQEIEEGMRAGQFDVGTSKLPAFLYRVSINRADEL